MAPLLFIAFAFSEIWLLTQVGELTSGWAALAWVVAAFVVGGAVMRSATRRLASLTGQGEGATIMTPLGFLVFQQRRQAPRPRDVLDATLVATAGVLFMWPGLVSDLFAALLLIPAVRGLVVGRILRAASGEAAPPREPRPARPSRRRSGRAVDPSEVEVLPPNAARLPPARRPVIIDVE